METLQNQAYRTTTEERVANNQNITIKTFWIKYPKGNPYNLPTGDGIPKTIANKPLVDYLGDALIPEIAVVKMLERDGYEAIWVDTFHGNFRNDNPPNKITLPSSAQAIYDGIVALRGGRPSGFFDVMAWKGDNFVFLECKSKSEKPNANETAFIVAAIKYGIDPSRLFFVRREWQ